MQKKIHTLIDQINSDPNLSILFIERTHTAQYYIKVWDDLEASLWTFTTDKDPNDKEYRYAFYSFDPQFSNTYTLEDVIGPYEDNLYALELLD